MSPGRVIVAGCLFGGLAWMVFRGAQGSQVDTDDGQAQGWLNGYDDMMAVAYQVGGNNDMQISLAGLAAIKREEALSLVRYDDATGKALAKGQAVKGYATIGYGHKLGALENYWTITQAEADRLLVSDLSDAEAAVNRLVKVPLTQNQYDALVSFVFNVGGGAFSRSTLLRLLNAKDYAGAAKQFPAWRKSAGVVLQGLVKRRANEMALFLGQGVHLS